MATEVIVTIKPSGGDYTSLSAAEAGEQRNLILADEIAVLECHSMQDTTGVVFGGWVTNSTRYIKIYTPLSERHDGKWNTGKYFLNISTGIALDIQEDNVRVEGLQITSGDDRAIVIGPFSGYVSDYWISHSIFKGNAILTFSGIAKFFGVIPGSKLRMWNNVFFDCTGTGLAGIILADAHLTAYIFNNTFQNCQRGITLTAISQEYIKNNLIDAVDAFAGTFTNDDNFNNYNSISQNLDDDAVGSNGRYNQNFTYVDEDGDDFHLASGDGGAKDFGGDLSSDPGLPFNDDIDGNTRSGTWDIGADEFVSAGVFVTPNPITGVAASIIGTIILGSTTAAPSPVSVIAGRINPPVILGPISFTPSAINCVTEKGDPAVVLGALAIAPTPVGCISERVNPRIILGPLAITPAQIDCIASGFDPSVLAGGAILDLFNARLVCLKDIKEIICLKDLKQIILIG